MPLKPRGTRCRIVFAVSHTATPRGFMTALANQPSSRRRLLLASDRTDQSIELASILRSVGEVDTISTSEIPDSPAGHFAGIVVDINLRSPETVQRVRDKLRTEAYRAMPRLFVL